MPRLIMFFTFLVFCFASTALSENVSYFGQCDAQGFGCKLQAGEVPGTTLDYHAEFKVTYDFRCISPYKSNIRIFSTDPESYAYLYFDTVSEITVTGMGPLRLEDTNPVNTGNDALSNSCQLIFPADGIKITPSARQLSVWQVEKQGIIENLKTARDTFAKQRETMFWRKNFNKSPDNFRSTIEKIVAEYRNSPNIYDQLQADLYQLILDQAPDSEFDALYGEIKSESDKILVRAKDYLDKTMRAGLLPDVILNEEIVKMKIASKAA